MFGGVAFMDRGNMCVGVVKNELMVRVGKENHDNLVAKPHARVMDFTNKPMMGYLYIAPEGIKTEKQLCAWIDHALAFTKTLQSK